MKATRTAHTPAEETASLSTGERMDAAAHTMQQAREGLAALEQELAEQQQVLRAFRVQVYEESQAAQAQGDALRDDIETLRQQIERAERHLHGFQIGTPREAPAREALATMQEQARTLEAQLGLWEEDENARQQKQSSAEGEIRTQLDSIEEQIAERRRTLTLAEQARQEAWDEMGQEHLADWQRRVQEAVQAERQALEALQAAQVSIRSLSEQAMQDLARWPTLNRETSAFAPPRRVTEEERLYDTFEAYLIQLARINQYRSSDGRWKLPEMLALSAQDLHTILGEHPGGALAANSSTKSFRWCAKRAWQFPRWRRPGGSSKEAKATWQESTRPGRQPPSRLSEPFWVVNRPSGHLIFHILHRHLIGSLRIRLPDQCIVQPIREQGSQDVFCPSFRVGVRLQELLASGIPVERQGELPGALDRQRHKVDTGVWRVQARWGRLLNCERLPAHITVHGSKPFSGPFLPHIEVP
jgi:hypothetical protein